MFYLINSNSTRQILAIWLIFVVVGVAHGLPEDVDQPIHVSGDKAEMDQTNGLIHYRGNVRLIQGTLVVNAAALTLEVKDQKVVKITASGNTTSGPARYEQTLKKNEAKVFADAKKIVYLTQEDLIELTGDAHLSQNNNRFSGAKIDYDVKAGRVKASSSEEAPVQMTLEPAVIKH